MTPEGIAHGSSEPVSSETRATETRETPSIVVKLPPTNSVVPSGASAIERTLLLATAANVLETEPSWFNATMLPFGCPSTCLNAPPT